MEATDTSLTNAARTRRIPAHAIVLVAVLVVYLALCVKLIALLPLYGAVHDEPVHFGYCKYLAVKGKLPPLAQIPNLTAPDCYRLPSAGAAAHHPPGYYFLGSLVIRAFGGSSLAMQNYAVRSLSLLLGLVALVLFYLALRNLLPNSLWIAVGLVALVAVFPEWLMVSSVIYPETFGAVGVTGALWMLARYARKPAMWEMAAAGAFVAMMALTKYTMVPFCLAMLWIAIGLAIRTRKGWRVTALQSLAFVGTGVAVAGWWYVRNMVMYGKLFPTTDIPGKVDMVTMLFVPQGRFRYWIVFTGLFRYPFGPADWLPEGARTVMRSIAQLTWISTIVGLVVGYMRRDRGLASLWRRFLLPFVCGLALFMLMYLRWAVTTAIGARGEIGKFLMPVLGFNVLMLGLAAQGLLGRRRALWVIGLFVLFFLVWDVLAVYNIQTVILPRSPILPAPWRPGA